MTCREKFEQIYKGIDFEARPFGSDWKLYLDDREEVYRLIVDSLNDGLVLDDGGGFGFLGTLLDDGQYFNLDLSRNIIKYDHSPNRMIASGSHAPFQDCMFDNVVSYGVVRYVPEWMLYFKEAYRVLKNGGKFVVSTIRKEWQRDTLNRPIFWLSLMRYKSNFQAFQTMKNQSGESVVQDHEGNPISIYDKYWEENELATILENIGFTITVRRHVGYYLEGIKLLTKHGYDPEKHGYFLFYVCVKEVME